MAATPEEIKIANWMLEEYQKHQLLDQTVAAHSIRQKFGESHTFINSNGNVGINKAILEEFKKLTPNDVVWSRSNQHWRKRAQYDPPDKRMTH